nr:TPA_asm: hexon [Orchesella springtail adintovirus]
MGRKQKRQRVEESSHSDKKITRNDFVRSESNLFHEPGYDITINSSSTNAYHPTSTLSDTAPITFFIQGNDTQHIDMSKTKLKVRFKIVGASGGDLVKFTDKQVLEYGPVNYLLASAFDRVTVSLNETEITPKSSLYPYQAMFETLLSYSTEFKKSQAEAAGFFRTKDEAASNDDGWISRRTLSNESIEFELIGRPHGEIFTQTRYLPPGIDIRLQLHRSSNAFSLMCTGSAKENIKLSILEAKLYVEKLTLAPSVQVSLLNNWEENPCVYPSKRVEMKSYSLPTGTYQDTNESLITGLIPDRLIFGIVKTANIQGAYDRNPFNFDINGLSQIIVTCNSEQSTQHIINIDKDENRLLEGYMSLFDSMGVTNCDPGLDIRLNEFSKGKALYGINLRNVTEGFGIPRHGNVSIYLKFKAALTSSVTIVLYPEYQNVMYINSDKQIYFKDYARKYEK